MIKTPNYQKALREHTNTILLFLHQLDKLVGPNKEIPEQLSKDLAKLANWLEMQNDTVRFGVLDISYVTDDKERVIKKLLEKRKSTT